MDPRALARVVAVVAFSSTLGCAAAVDQPSEESSAVTEGAAKHTCVDNVMCMIGTHWSATKCACVADSKKCTTDADCRLADDYCTGCNCVALATHEKLPVCSGPGVRCFAEPCLGKTAACVAGTCSAR